MLYYEYRSYIVKKILEVVMEKTMLDYINTIPDLVKKNLFDPALTNQFIDLYKEC